MPRENNNLRDTFSGVEIHYLWGIEDINAWESITGSCTLFTAQDHSWKKVTIVVDFWAHQQWMRANDLNREVDKRVVNADYLIITHAHIDHIGRVPMLQKAWFKGKIFMTHHTKLLWQLSLLDSARLMQRQYDEFARRMVQRRNELQDTLRYIQAIKRKEKNNFEGTEKETIVFLITEIENRYWFAKLEENIQYLKSKNISETSSIENILKKPLEPLFTEQDVKDFFQLGNIQILEAGQFTHLNFSLHSGAKDIRDRAQMQKILLRFTDAGHIVGSVQAEIAIRTSETLAKWFFGIGKKPVIEDKRYVLSGDLWREDLWNLAWKVMMQSGEFEYAQMESTYAWRPNHREREEFISELFDTLLQAKGSVILPTFALQRTQDIGLLLLRYYDEVITPRKIKLIEEQKWIQKLSNQDIESFRTNEQRLQEINDELSRLEFKVYFDSNLWKNITSILSTQTWSPYNALNEAAQIEKYGEILLHFIDPMVADMLSQWKVVEIWGQMHGEAVKKIFISSGGMCEGGPVINHLKHHVSRNESTIIFTWYAPPSSLGWRLRSDPIVLIEGEVFTVNAQIYALNGFSGHADNATLEKWASSFRTQILSLTHGWERREVFSKGIKKQKWRKILIPQVWSKLQLPFLLLWKGKLIPEFEENGMVYEWNKNADDEKYIPNFWWINGLLEKYPQILEEGKERGNIDELIPYILLIKNQAFFNILKEDFAKWDKDIYTLLILISQFFQENTEHYNEILTLTDVTQIENFMELDTNLILDFLKWKQKKEKTEKRSLKSKSPFNTTKGRIYSQEEREFQDMQTEYNQLISQFQSVFSHINFESEGAVCIRRMLWEIFDQNDAFSSISDFYLQNISTLSSDDLNAVYTKMRDRESIKQDISLHQARKSNVIRIWNDLFTLFKSDLRAEYIHMFMEFHHAIHPFQNDIRSLIQHDAFRANTDEIVWFWKLITYIESLRSSNIQVSKIGQLVIEISYLLKRLKELEEKIRPDQKTAKLLQIINIFENFIFQYTEKTKEFSFLQEKILGYMHEKDLAVKWKSQQAGYQNAVNYLTWDYTRRVSPKRREEILSEIPVLISKLKILFETEDARKENKRGESVEGNINNDYRFYSATRKRKIWEIIEKLEKILASATIRKQISSEIQTIEPRLNFLIQKRKTNKIESSIQITDESIERLIKLFHVSEGKEQYSQQIEKIISLFTWFESSFQISWEDKKSIISQIDLLKDYANNFSQIWDFTELIQIWEVLKKWYLQEDMILQFEEELRRWVKKLKDIFWSAWKGNFTENLQILLHDTELLENKMKQYAPYSDQFWDIFTTISQILRELSSSHLSQSSFWEIKTWKKAFVDIEQDWRAIEKAEKVNNSSIFLNGLLEQAKFPRNQNQRSKQNKTLWESWKVLEKVLQVTTKEKDEISALLRELWKSNTEKIFGEHLVILKEKISGYRVASSHHIKETEPILDRLINSQSQIENLLWSLWYEIPWLKTFFTQKDFKSIHKSLEVFEGSRFSQTQKNEIEDAIQFVDAFWNTSLLMEQRKILLKRSKEIVQEFNKWENHRHLVSKINHFQAVFNSLSSKIEKSGENQYEIDKLQELKGIFHDLSSERNLNTVRSKIASLKSQWGIIKMKLYGDEKWELERLSRQIDQLKRELKKHDYNLPLDIISNYEEQSFYGLSSSDTRKYISDIKELLYWKREFITDKTIAKSKRKIEHVMSHLKHEVQILEWSIRWYNEEYVQYKVYPLALEFKKTILGLFQGIFTPEFYDNLSDTLADKFVYDFYARPVQSQEDIQHFVLSFLQNESLEKYLSDPKIMQLTHMREKFKEIQNIIQDSYCGEENYKTLIENQEVSALERALQKLSEYMNTLSQLHNDLWYILK